MEQMQIAVARMLRIGVAIALLCVCAGGVVYLYQHAGDSMQYHTFHGAALEATSVKAIIVELAQFTPRALMQFGVLLLIMIQVLRVAMIAWHFLKMADYKFVVISVFVLLVMVGVVAGIF